MYEHDRFRAETAEDEAEATRPVVARFPAGRARRRRRRGMSLVEVMVVIAIIVTLMGVIGYGVMQVFGDTQVDTTMLQMHEVNKRVEIHTLRRGSPPSTSDGLRAVYGGEDPPRDAWGNEFIYVSPGPDGMPYDIISYGSDGREGGTGNAADIRWSEISRR